MTSKLTPEMELQIRERQNYGGVWSNSKLQMRADIAALLLELDTFRPKPDGVLEGVGPLLRRLRTRCGLTQAALSKRCGVCRSLLSMLETGSREASLDQLRVLESVFVELGVLSGPGTLFFEVGRRLADATLTNLENE